MAGALCLALAIVTEYLEANPVVLYSLEQNAFLNKTHFLWVLEETLENLGAVFVLLSIARYANQALQSIWARRALTEETETKRERIAVATCKSP